MPKQAVNSKNAIYEKQKQEADEESRVSKVFLTNFFNDKPQDKDGNILVLAEEKPNPKQLYPKLF